jgi:Zn-finger nucleic acid-binding protein
MRQLPEAARCPRDGARLAPRSLAGVDFLACLGCGGLWLPRDRLETMALRIAGGARPPRSGARAGLVVHEGTARCACPRAPLMASVQAHGVTLDRCAACGAVWLDGGELRRVVESYVGPGHVGAAAMGADLADGLGSLSDAVDVLGLLVELLGGLLEALLGLT